MGLWSLHLLLTACMFIIMKKRRYRNIRNKVKPWKKRKARQMAMNMTMPERLLWHELRNKKLGVWFYAQKIVLGYIPDFWCPSAGIIVEVDGPHHRKKKQAAWDAKRDAVMAERDIVTMRFTASAVRCSPAKVAMMIKKKVRMRTR